MEKNLELRVSELEKMLFLSKNVLSFDEASKFLNLSKSYLYKLTGNRTSSDPDGQYRDESGCGSRAPFRHEDTGSLG